MDALQQRIGYRFSNVRLLTQALTHRSYSAVHNERLEFLGDSVLNLVIAARLFAFLPDVSEGDLSRIRAHLVRESTLYQLALGLQLNTVLRLGEGELKSGGSQRPSILADALEAMIGAIYLDGGFDAAKAFIDRIFDAEFQGQHSRITAQSWGKDAKTALQEWMQGRHLGLPSYTISATHGALHNQIFDVQCSVSQLGISASGQGSSRRLAEQDAAQKVLLLLHQTYGENPKHIKKPVKVPVMPSTMKQPGAKKE